ncbi:hypothetical protein DL96DRAFT_845173 [Flagelloscypha sp. PMI_526]|nr:hypothetical protein DL96DRAFT_845173 [Flagelloscypha sp. PMI_526]
MQFENLHSDLIRAILLELYKTDKSTNATLPFSLSNRKLRLIALPFIYRTCRIDYATSGARLIQLWSTDSAHNLPLQYIRDLVVQHSLSESVEEGGYRPATEAESTIHWETFVSFVRQLSCLYSLTWDNTSPIPITVLEALHQRHPSSHLHIPNWSRRDRSAKFGEDAGEQILARSPCLQTISATYSLESGLGWDYTEAALSQIVALAPNLKSVRCLRQEIGGCCVCVMTDEARQFFDAESAKFTNSLVTPSVKHAVPEILWPNLKVGVLSSWSRFLDFGQTTRLDLDLVGMELLVYVASSPLPLFPHLKALSFRVPWNENVDVANALQRFVAAFNPLQELTVKSYRYHDFLDLEQCLHLHGRTLTSLTLHQEEDRHRYQVRQVLSPEQLQLIASNCVSLRHLGIDVNRNDAKLDDSVYTFLHRFPYLQSLTLYLGLFLEKQETHPVVDEEFTLRIWEAIPSTILDLLIYVGEPDRERERGWPVDWMGMERASKQLVTVQRDSDGGECKVYVQAPKKLRYSTSLDDSDL